LHHCRTVTSFGKIKVSVVVDIMLDASERLQVLLSQEEVVYKTSDYLAKMNTQAQQQLNGACDTTRSISPSSSTSPKKRKSCDDGDVCADEQSPPSTRSSPGDDDDEGTSSTQINKHWREKICEWAYQGKSSFS
jgi:hypothetical protein